MSGAQVDITELQDPQALRKIARFVMEDDAKSITRDSLRGYLTDEYPDLTEDELTKLVRAVHDQINDAVVTIGWPGEEQ